MVSKVTSIPDVPQNILKAASEGKLVVFIGAGVSRIIGCPSWEEFAVAHLKHLEENGCIDSDEFGLLKKLDPKKILSICRDVISESIVPKPDVREILRANDELIEKHRIYENIYKFNSIFITTNYDDYLDRVARGVTEISYRMEEGLAGLAVTHRYDEMAGSPKEVYQRKELLISKLKNGNVVHLHGSMHDEDSMIVTIVDYMNHYHKHFEPAFLLEELFRSYTVLFIGYGLEETEILEFMISRSAKLGEHEIKHALLLPMKKENQNIVKFYKSYYSSLGVSIIPYDISENGYDQLAKVIEKWAKIIGPIAKQSNLYDKLKLIDEVL